MPMGEVKNDWRVIACNFIERTSECSKGALAYVIGVPGDPARIHLLARSRSGRWIDKWESLRRLDNFRFKTLPPEHPRYGDRRMFDYGGYAQKYLDWLVGAKAEPGLGFPNPPLETRL